MWSTAPPPAGDIGSGFAVQESPSRGDPGQAAQAGRDGSGLTRSEQEGLKNYLDAYARLRGTSGGVIFFGNRSQMGFLAQTGGARELLKDRRSNLSFAESMLVARTLASPVALVADNRLDDYLIANIRMGVYGSAAARLGPVQMAIELDVFSIHIPLNDGRNSYVTQGGSAILKVGPIELMNFSRTRVSSGGTFGEDAYRSHWTLNYMSLPEEGGLIYQMSEGLFLGFDLAYGIKP